MSFFAEADIFIGVCNSCIFNVVEMRSYIFICFCIGFTCNKKLLQRCSVQHSNENMIQRGIQGCLFSGFLWKNREYCSNVFTIAGGLVGHPRDMLDFLWPILKSCVFKLIYFHQQMGQDPSKRRRRRTLKPEAVSTIFQHVPQPKASTQRKHLTMSREL